MVTFLRVKREKVNAYNRFAFSVQKKQGVPDAGKLHNGMLVYRFEENGPNASSLMIKGESKSQIVELLRSRHSETVFEIKRGQRTHNDQDACYEQEMMRHNGHQYTPGSEYSTDGLPLRFEWQEISLETSPIEIHHAGVAAFKNIALAVGGSVNIGGPAAIAKDIGGAVSDVADLASERVAKPGSNGVGAVVLLISTSVGESTMRTSLTGHELAVIAEDKTIWTANSSFNP